jgi:hypothetical protein
LKAQPKLVLGYSPLAFLLPTLMNFVPTGLVFAEKVTDKCSAYLEPPFVTKAKKKFYNVDSRSQKEKCLLIFSTFLPH